jgi:uncharacterized protein YegP (UPF0339 family)
MKVTVYRAQDGWRWRARAANGEIVSESGEAYENKSYASFRLPRSNADRTLTTPALTTARG